MSMDTFRSSDAVKSLNRGEFQSVVCYRTVGHPSTMEPLLMPLTCYMVLGIISLVLFQGVRSGPYPSMGGNAEDAAERFHDYVIPGVHNAHQRYRRAIPTVADRPSCQQYAELPANRVTTTRQLLRLRDKMAAVAAAYIVPMDDAHQSEYVSDHDKRVQFISGFSGSAGTAVILADKAALWVDGRYFLQGEQQLDCQWILMKQGDYGVPTITEWLTEELANGASVAADPQMMSYDRWQGFASSLNGINLVVQSDLVGEVWDELGDRPPPSNKPVFVLSQEFSGVSWQDKVNEVRRGFPQMTQAVAITALDEVAWLFNLRGSDIKYNPVFYAYSIVEKDNVTLYLLGHDTRVTDEMKRHLNPGQEKSCTGGDSCVQIKPYAAFYVDVAALSAKPGEIWVSPMSSYALFSTLYNTVDASSTQIYLAPSYIRTLKGRKNPVEIEGLRKCHIRDSAALIEFVSGLEKDVKEGLREWDEISASDALDNMRKQLKYNQGLSFGTISASGSNGAVIHYRATEATKKPITTNDMYLLDSGGQYFDGTTDVTRTFHFGQPTDFEKEAYTRVLMGVIDLATAVWPSGTFGRDIDVLARRPLWAVGLNYRHGTGHGIGAYLNVHEGPGRINIGYRATDYESPLKGEMFFSDEPGYYEDGQFGVRLETIVMTTPKRLPHNFGNRDYLGFREFTLVPFEPHLIKLDMLNSDQRRWLNNYHHRVQEEVAEGVLKPAGKKLAYDWVTSRTRPVPDIPTYNQTSAYQTSVATSTIATHVYTLTVLATVLCFIDFTRLCKFNE